MIQRATITIVNFAIVYSDLRGLILRVTEYNEVPTK